MALTRKQTRFVDAYLGGANCNASEAARLAGYSAKTAAEIGYENLRKPEIRAAIDAGFESRFMGPSEVLSRLSEQARADMSRFLVIGEGGQLEIDFRAAQAAGILRLVKKCSFDRNGNPSVELYDAQAALVHLGRHLGLFVERHEVAGPGGGPIPVALGAALERVYGAGENEQPNPEQPNPHQSNPEQPNPEQGP